MTLIDSSQPPGRGFECNGDISSIETDSAGCSLCELRGLGGAADSSQFPQLDDDLGDH